MNEDAIAEAHQHMAEQLMSDERILGALPEDAAGVLLDWALARLDAAAATAADVDAFVEAADRIRREMRAEADAAAERGDDAAALSARLSSAPSLSIGCSDTPSAGTADSLWDRLRRFFTPRRGDA